MYGLHQAEAQKFLKICLDHHQGLSPIFRGPCGLHFAVATAILMAPLWCEILGDKRWGWWERRDGGKQDINSYMHPWILEIVITII